MKGGALSATALKIALRGLLLATGVGAAIMGLTWVIQKLTDASDDARDSLEKLNDAEDAYTEVSGEAKGKIDQEIKALKDLIDARKSSQEVIDHLNETYGTLFGKHNTEKEWYDILIQKSQQYVKQLGYEAQAKALTAQKDKASAKKDLAAEKVKDLEESGKHKKKQNITVGGGGVNGYVQIHTVEVETKEYKEAKKELADVTAEEAELQKKLDEIDKKSRENEKNLKSGTSGVNKELKVSEMNWNQVTEAIEKTEKSLKGTTDSKKIKKLSAYNAQLKARKKILDQQLGLGSQNKNRSGSKKKTEVADPKTAEELSTNIEIYRKKLTDEDTEEQRIYREKIARWEKAKDAIEQLQKQAERPSSLSTLEDIDAEINYQRSLRSKATKENIAGIDAEIKRLEELREEIELSSHTPVPIDQIKTFRQLNDEISYYTVLLEKADVTQREAIQKHLNQLKEVDKQWHKALDELKKPGDISTLDNIQKLEEAISYYQTKQKEASGDEIQNIQKTIDAHERKRAAMQRGIELPSMKREADEINKLTGREYKLKIGSMGFDELTEKIRELQKMLNDTENPVTDSQRKDIESLIGVYEKWRKEGVQTFETYRSGWDGLKGIGNGVESLTSALEGNGNAWQKVTGIVDGFLQIYDGIKTIVGIINMLSKATTTHTAAKTAETAAVTASAGAQTAEAATSEATAAAQIPVIAANKIATASYMELAAAAYFAAHASIPLAGFGIASGFVTAATSMVEAIGVMPFADGGIVSGPTLGLVGEYAGAKNNPEVIAPLDKLRSLLGTDYPATGRVVFRIDGRSLVGVLGNETRIASKSGKRTNIKI